MTIVEVKKVNNLFFMFLKKFEPDNDEKIIFYVHRHWIVFLKDTIAHIIVLVFAIVLFIWVYYNWNQSLEKLIGIPRSLIINIFIIILICLLILYVIVFWNKYIDWFYDVLILTNKRIVEINQKFLFGREIRSLSLDQITSVKSLQQGIIGSILKFGTLHIKTAAQAANSDVIFDYVPNHEKLQNIIQDTKSENSIK